MKFFFKRIALSFCIFFAPILSVVAQGRLTLNFNPDWKFIKADPTNAQSVNFDDRNWKTISTPHTYNDTDTFDNFSPGGMHGETNQWSGRTWYRKSFVLPKSLAGKKVYVEFEAVRQVAEVYLNGHYLGACKNGFIPFGFDLTPYFKFGKTNILAVMCDNRFMISAIGAPPPRQKILSGTNGIPQTINQFEDVVNSSIPESVEEIQANQIPWNNPQWHPPLGGIYRNVRLYVTDQLHITLPLYDFLKTVGPYVYATKISKQTAEVTIEIPFENGRAQSEKISVQAEIFDADGKSVATLNRTQEISAGAQSTVKFSLALAHPQLWEPDFPYLYHVVCSLHSGNQTIDSCTVPLGIRAVHWDVRTGFWINGHHLKLHGWGQRPTDEWPGLGTAQPDWLHFYTLDLMKRAGGNFIRWGHCAGGPDMIEAGDELGLIADQPGVDGESDTTGAAWKIRADAFRDTLIYFRNDPSILIWEGGNQKVTREHAAQLRGLKDKFDPGGGRAYAHRRADEITGEFMDVSIGTEGSHEVRRLPVVEGEYDREESPRRVWDNKTPPDFGYPQAAGQTYDLTSEQFAVNEISQYLRKIGAANHSGGGNWLFSDGTSGGRDTAEVDRSSGEVDGVRLPKEAYFVCQTIFRNNPQVHIIGHWNYPAGTKKTVYVVSNCHDVKLFVNGKSLGGKKSENYLFTFENVIWQPGEIKAVGFNDDVSVATNIIRTAGAATALRLTAITGPDGLQANGSDVALIDVEAVDEKGERCPTFQNRVSFDCAGPAIWRGGYNSGVADSINKKYLNLEAGINRVAVRSTLQPGKIIITARCPGLKTANITIPSNFFPVTNGYSMRMPAVPVFPLPTTHFNWSALSNSVPPMSVTDASNDSKSAGRFIQSFAYTGLTTAVHIESNAADGERIYCDRDYTFKNLPREMAGADWVQTADSDRTFSAADLMQIEIKTGALIYVAFDRVLKSPEWLNQFKLTQINFSINGRAMNVFEHRASRDESLTFGSETDSNLKTANMYVVFVQNSD